MLFSYKAVDREGRMVSGKYDASERAQVIAYIKAQKMTPVSIGNGVNMDSLSIFTKRKPRAKDLSMFCEQFCSLIRAGVTVIDALRLLLEQTANKTLSDGIQTAIVAVNEGESLGSAMSKSPAAFDETLINLIKAGEASGSLDKSLERMGQQYKKDAEVEAAIKKAMVYPIIVLIVAMAVIVFMLMVIVPKFMDMFSDVGIEMPKITIAVVNMSQWLIDNFIIALLILVGTILGLMIFSKSKTGKKCKSWLALHIPGVNNFVTQSSASKIARTLSTLLTAGMTVVEALTILETTLPNYYYKKAIREVKEDVLIGQPMSRKFIERKDMFPHMLSHMIAVGEDTGDMTSMLLRTADYYDLEVETATESMMSMLQPAIIILLTGIVGVILAAVLSPMVALYSQLGDAL